MKNRKETIRGLSDLAVLITGRSVRLSAFDRAGVRFDDILSIGSDHLLDHAARALQVPEGKITQICGVLPVWRDETLRELFGPPLRLLETRTVEAWDRLRNASPEESPGLCITDRDGRLPGLSAYLESLLLEPDAACALPPYTFLEGSEGRRIAWALGLSVSLAALLPKSSFGMAGMDPDTAAYLPAPERKAARTGSADVLMIPGEDSEENTEVVPPESPPPSPEQGAANESVPPSPPSTPREGSKEALSPEGATPLKEATPGESPSPDAPPSDTPDSAPASEPSSGPPEPEDAPPPVQAPPDTASPESAMQGKQTPPPPGHTRSLKAMKIEQVPDIDGNLDDPAWKDAPVASDFWISEYGIAPQEKTEVRVLYDEKFLYFAFTCHDTQPQAIHADQRKRDGNVSLDDHVKIQLDPYHNHRQVSEFSVSARGTQSDAMAGGRARKIEWKGDWQAAVQRNEQGWTAEVRIPFDILNYNPKNPVFGINFVRYHARKKETSRWADVTPQYLPEETGHLTGLAFPKNRVQDKLAMMQYLSAGHRMPNKAGNLKNLLGSTGFDFRYDRDRNFTNVLSLNPDFSQIEEDVLDLGFNYNEKLRADRRPFFQEGNGFFGNRTFFHSSRVPNFDVGLKSFGKTGPIQLGALGVQSPEGRRDYVVRAVKEMGSTASAGVTLVETDRSEFRNRLIGVDIGGRFRKNLVANANWSVTDTSKRAGNGTRSLVSLGYESAYWQTGIALDRTGLDYFPANGYIAGDTLGTQGKSAFVSYGKQYASGPLYHFSGSLSYNHRDTLSGLSQSRNVSLYVGGELRSNVLFNVGTTVGPYRPKAKEAGQWASMMHRDRFYTASLFFDSRSDRRGYGLTYSWGSLGGGRYSNLSPNFWVRPRKNLYLSYSYEHAYSFGDYRQQIMSLSWEMTPEQSLSFRWVNNTGGAYRLAYRKAVRRGIDVYAVYRKDPGSRGGLSVKLLRALVL
ncbi:MAG: hypothetical protein KY468_03395 [Armatimonadetes bacterium]|nr:hypothetical protein [Armatimonadota bacterium]